MSETQKRGKMGQFYNPDRMKLNEWKAQRAAEAEGLRQHTELLGAMEVLILSLHPPLLVLRFL